jgi:L-threonylcarbamoyladenylate synthase
MPTNDPNPTRVLAVDPIRPDPDALREAGRILRRGGLVIVPTETVYGIAADARNPAAIARLRAAKARPDAKALPVMVAGNADIEFMATHVPPMASRLAGRFWPGPLTMVLHAAPGLVEAVHAGTGKVALRAPDHAVAQGVLAEAGCPLVLTSANMSGEAPARTAAEAVAALGGRVDLVLDAGRCRLGEPSTVLDLTTDPPSILRAGTLSGDDLRDTIHSD